MGDEVAGVSFTREQRQRYREKVRQCLDVFERMLSEHSFEFERPLTGLEIELNLVDDEFSPTMRNAAVLESIADPDYQTELGQFNIELNVHPRPLPGDSALELEESLRASLNAAEAKANDVGAHIIMIGILPTVMPEHFHTEWMSANPRYAALNESVFAARGEDLLLDISSPTTPERVSAFADTIAPEAACTSVQLHLQVSPQDFAANWNAAQTLLGPQVALG
ncbi:MAG TPA: glutamate--cysteine ligase, partial [Angustibacter sp.]|nr:glutamate--cysteine ligase [Angustibacter sp.]